MLRGTFVAAAAAKVALSRTRRPIKAAIEITDAAAERIKSLLASKADAIGIRVGVKTRGCNGDSYTMNYVTAPAPAGGAASGSATPAKPGSREEVVVDKGVAVYIDPAALLKIVGTRMDWRETDEVAEFVFDNPNAKAVCGCGESFKV